MSEHFSNLGTSVNRLKAYIAAAAVMTVLVLTACGVCAAAVQADAHDHGVFYITFQVPGSTGTAPASINNFSTVAGNYADTNRVSHGFIRDVFGKITVFDPAGSTGTSVSGINDEGTITGSYTDANSVTHGFVRHPRGKITSFDVPGSTSTGAASINAFGQIAGVYFDANGSQSFIRSREGTITTFGPQTHAVAINLFGAITGFTRGNSEILIDGFLRSPEGTITTFSDPSTNSSGTYPDGIDAFGDIAGNYFNSRDIQVGFVRSAEGVFATIAPTDSLQTQVSAINELGAITGFYDLLPMGGADHGFVRDTQGNITTFDVPGGDGTIPTSINDFGVIAGYSGTSGFLRVPY
jgi:predicted membrane protein